MIDGSRIFQGLLLAAAWWMTMATMAGGGEVRVSESVLSGRPVISLDNGLVRLSVTPQIGGRVMEFVHLATASNAARIRADNIHRQPDDAWVGADYGGFSDAATTGWPGPMWGVTYDAKVVDGQAPGSKSIVVTGEAGGMRIERTMTLAPDSTLMDIHIRQTNTSDAPQRMIVRLHCEQGAGPLADEEDFIYWMGPEGLSSIRYIYGAEYARFAWLEVQQGWVAAIDRQAAEGFVRLFPDGDTQRVFYWSGYNESPAQLGLGGAFFGLDRFGPEQTVAPGASTEAREQMFLVRGIDRADFVTGTTAGALEFDRARYGSGDTVHAQLRLAGATAIDAHVVELQLCAGDQVLLTQEAEIAPAGAGEAATCAVLLKLPDLPDDAYTVQAIVRPAGGGEPIGTASRDFEVIEQLVRKARAAQEAMLASMTQFEQQAGGVEAPPLWLRTELKVLALRRAQVGQLLEQGDYEQALALAQQVHADVQSLHDRLAKHVGHAPGGR